MREDQREILDKTFPLGYVIVYNCPNKKKRIAWHKPNDDVELNSIINIIKEATDEPNR